MKLLKRIKVETELIPYDYVYKQHGSSSPHNAGGAS
jgi:hypothetical protein